MLELIGLIIGLVIGLISPWTIPVQWSLYAACGLRAALDAALGGFRARIKGEFKLGVFLSDFCEQQGAVPPEKQGPHSPLRQLLDRLTAPFAVFRTNYDLTFFFHDEPPGYGLL